jgi:hypothetical protein
MSTLRLPVPIPCLDEAETVATCLTKAIGWMDRHGVDGEVLVADNCSTYLERCLLIGTLPTSGGSRLPDVSPPGPNTSRGVRESFGFLGEGQLTCEQDWTRRSWILVSDS